MGLRLFVWMIAVEYVDHTELPYAVVRGKPVCGT